MRCSTYLFYCIYYLQTDHILQPHRNKVQKITNGKFLWSDDFDETLISLRKDCQKKILAVKHHQQGSGSSRHWDTVLRTTPIFVCSWTNFSTAWMHASHTPYYPQHIQILQHHCQCHLFFIFLMHQSEDKIVNVFIAPTFLA